MLELALALRNLFDNALQHTPGGTGQSARPSSTERLGLGHKIVGRVMDIHGGSFALAPASSPSRAGGRCYRLTFVVPDLHRPAPGKR
ncbi:MAG: hypothetical protein Q8R06_10325 [Polaromonas sp.]|uniref:hypothetical protein n=1 Tax=Polaromonas sp. TaxID=1869339 RepID=UPI002737497A|nr:hypothetical protein [Polaromonas sp.]MDP3797530.1 hypothetical protein [Polaromonas sp.]